MNSATVELRSVEGTQAAMGWAGLHTIVVDRPEGKAGGMGLGFNGAQLLGLTIGGCFCNDLRYVAAELRVPLGKIAVSVTVMLDGDPLLAISATMKASCETLDGSDPSNIIKRAQEGCMAINSFRLGFPIKVEG